MLNFYKNKRILITGHTGFKGTWLAQILINAGANVTGYALEPPTNPNLFTLCSLDHKMHSIHGDIRDLTHLMQVFDEIRPEIVFHLAAQPIVRESYQNPVYTYETNVMGTVNLCECVRLHPCVKSFLNVTTDKVYQNNEWAWGYRENDTLNGFDPYSNSKSCSELVTQSYISSYFDSMEVAVSTARAGNVIGGGDFATDRIIPDCIRAATSHTPILIRNPYSIRPYQHVLEPLSVYLMIAKSQYENKALAGSYNVGPDDNDCVTTGRLADIFCSLWGNNLNWISQNDSGPHEAVFLKLDCSKLKQTFHWKPQWTIEKAIEKTVEWTKEYIDGNNVTECMDRQIAEFFSKDTN